MWVYKYLFKSLPSVLLGYIPSSRIVRLYSNSVFNFLRNHRTMSTVAAPFYIPTSSSQDFQFFYILARTYYFLVFVLFYNSHPDGCEVVSHLDFVCVGGCMFKILFI